MIFSGLKITSQEIEDFSREQRAASYFRARLYEKAVEIYIQLYKKSPSSEEYLERIVECYLNMSDWKSARRYIKELKRKRRTKYYWYSELLEWRMREPTDTPSFEAAIRSIKTIEDVRWLFERMKQEGLWSECTEMLEYARKKFPGSFPYFVYLVEMHAERGNWPDMSRVIAEALKEEEGYLMQIEDVLGRTGAVKNNSEAFSILEKELVKYSQMYPMNNAYYHLLYWMNMHVNRWKRAYEFARALDMRSTQHGMLLYDFAMAVLSEGGMEYAVKALEFIIERYGTSSPYYTEATGLLLDCYSRMVQATTDSTVTARIDSAARAVFHKFMNSTHIFEDAIPVMMRYAGLAYMLGNYRTADSLAAIVMERGGRKYEGEAMILRGKVKIQMGELEDAFLWFLRIEDSDFSAEIRDLAGYYAIICQLGRGDIEWASAKARVLKGATSRLIANDALSILLYILDMEENDTILGKIIFHYSMGNHKRVIEMLEGGPYSFLTQFSPVAQLILGLSYFNTGKYEKSREILKGIHKETLPAGDILLYYLGMSHWKTNEKEEAEKIWLEMIKEYPGSMYSEKARMLLRKGKKVEM